jgi:hypothetical protein
VNAPHADPWRCGCVDCERLAVEALDLVMATFAAEAAPFRPVEVVRVTRGVL